MLGSKLGINSNAFVPHRLLIYKSLLAYENFIYIKKNEKETRVCITMKLDMKRHIIDRSDILFRIL